jgi:hypothetical protein
MPGMTYFETVKCDLAQRHQPRLLARHQHLIEIERQSEVPKSRRIVRAQADRNTVVQHRRDRVHGYRGGITLENAIKDIKVVSVILGDDKKPYQNLVPTSVCNLVGFIA